MARFEFTRETDPGAGLRTGAKGTQSSRTIMVAELERLLKADIAGHDLKRQVLDENLLEKATISGRGMTLQRLRELYGLEAASPLYRILRALWEKDPKSLPLLAMLAALARDPLLRATAKPVLGLAVGSELMRDPMRDALACAVGARLNEATLDKVVRNAASSWRQSGHLAGRTFKRRARVIATPAAMAYAIWLAQAAGFKGEDLLRSGWIAALDLEPGEVAPLLERTRAAALVTVRRLGAMTEIDASKLSAVTLAA